MYGADFKYDVENSVECHDVASLLPWQRWRRYVMIYSSLILIDTRNGKPITHLLYLPNFIALALSLCEIFPFEI